MKKSSWQTRCFIFMAISITGSSCNGQVQKELPEEMVIEPKTIAAGKPNTVPFSWEQESNLNPGMVTTDIETSKTTDDVESQKRIALLYDKYIDTRYEYADPNGKHLVIENSLPKGGLKYTDPDGIEYVYAIFWTRIANETADPFELSIDFPVDTFKLPSSPGNYFKIVLPSAQMTIYKASLFNYGLTDLNAVLDNKLRNSSSLQKTIHSNATSLIYVITLSKRGVDGTIRAGFSLKDDKLYYSVNDKEIYCGQSNIKNLKLQK